MGGTHVSSGPGTTPPLYSDRCKRHGNDPEPGNCGGCADVRKANAQQRPLAVVRSNHCLVHDEVFAERCNECEKDKRRATA